MKISVIVPIYNVENYLEKCLNSLVNQTLQEIEILVINDGSTDDSQKIIEDFQNKFPQKIKTFAKENGGLSDARNYGIDRATGIESTPPLLTALKLLYGEGASYAALYELRFT